MRYHLRIFALGVPAFTVLFALIYGMTFLPLWLAEAPLLIIITYQLGKLIELLWLKA